MESAAPYAYLKRKAPKTFSTIKKEQDYGLFNLEEDLDLNVFVLRFEKLKEAEKQMGVGDPFFCTECKSCLNKFSKVISRAEYENTYYLQKEKIEEKQLEKQLENKPKQQKLLQIPKNGSAWVCEFCGTHNTIMIEKQEIPIKDDMVYMLQSANQKMEVQSDAGSTVIFCIDNSGSMNSTTEVTGKFDLKHGLSEEQILMLKQFMEPGDQVQLNNNTGKTFVSRKQCVMAAIEAQLTQISKNDPNKRVGLITFNNEVVIFGDCSKQPVNILGNKLQNKDTILNDVAPLKVDSKVKQSYDKIIGNFNKIEASGATALGPAILSAIELASKGKIGSTVIICTDGLSNIGIGNFEGSLEESKEFYKQLADKAKLANIAVSIVSIKGQGCKLEALGVLAKQTNGNVSIINPEEIQTKFSNFLKDQIVATNVEVKIRLHKAVQFRNQFPQNLHQEGTLLIKNLANATVKTKVSFEYQLKPEDVLKNLGVQIQKLKVLPFQAQMIYTTTEGHRFIRVVTSTLDTTTDKKVVQNKVDKIHVVHDRMGQQTAFMVQRPQVKGFQSYNDHYMNYVQKVVENPNNLKGKEQKKATFEWNAAKNQAVVKAGVNKARKQEIKQLKSVPVAKQEKMALQKQQEMLMLEEDNDMEGIFSNYK